MTGLVPAIHVFSGSTVAKKTWMPGTGTGSGLGQVVFARIYLTHFERDYAAMNRVYESYFAPGHLPARTCIGVTGLARGALVEIDLLARRAQD